MDTWTLDVNAGQDTYKIYLGAGLLSELQTAVQAYPKHRIVIITDDVVAALYGKRICKDLEDRSPELIAFKAGESHKNLATFAMLQHELTKRRFVRDTLVLAFGGGVVGDMAGFVASTLARQVPYIQIPTTLLSIVDSSVGGKTAVDTPAAKNSVGRFYQPRAVVADLRFLETLPTEQFQNGLFEVIKTAFIHDSRMLDDAKELDLEEPLRKPTALRHIIERCIKFKADVVRRDPIEKGERKILNFGHTIGHAVESLSRFRMLHGYAVGHGMLVEAKISQLLGILSERHFERVRDTLDSYGIRGEGIVFSVKSILAKTRGDKKTVGGNPQYVLLKSPGKIYAESGQHAYPVEDHVVRHALELIRAL